jgi:hypothetical protein
MAHYSAVLKKENQELQARLTAYENHIRNLRADLLTNPKYSKPCENYVSTDDVARYLVDILDSVEAMP